MSERGVFAVDRGVWDHPMFASRDAFSKREAWMWLISEAAWKPHRRRIAGAMVSLARGQVSHSLRHLAECWGWSVKRVRGFLSDLEEDAMITTEADTGITVITVCKYNEYQRVSLPKGTDTGTQEDTEAHTATDTGRAHEGHNIEDKEDKETNTQAAAERRAPAKPLRFEEFWTEYPKRDGANPKKPAMKVYEQAVKSGQDEQAIIDGAKAYRTELRRRGQDGSQYVAQAQTWLRQSRWNDYPPTTGEAGSGVAPKKDWRPAMKFYAATPAYARTWPWSGSKPGDPGCEVPEDVLREFGFSPATPCAREKPPDDLFLSSGADLPEHEVIS